MRLALAAAVLAALASPLAAPAQADPVDDAVGLVRYVLCPAPEVDLCAPDPRVTCPLLTALAPAVDPVPDEVVRIDPDGDTYLAGRLVYECPPYPV